MSAAIKQCNSQHWINEDLISKICNTHFTLQISDTKLLEHGKVLAIAHITNFENCISDIVSNIKQNILKNNNTRPILKVIWILHDKLIFGSEHVHYIFTNLNVIAIKILGMIHTHYEYKYIDINNIGHNFKMHNVIAIVLDWEFNYDFIINKLLISE